MQRQITRKSDMGHLTSCISLSPSEGATMVLKMGGPGRAASPEFFLYFLSENGEFWCILGGAVCIATAQESEADQRGRKRKSPGEERHSALIGERPIHQILYFHLC